MSVTTLDVPIITTTQRWSIPVLTVFVLWVLVIFDPHLWLAPAVLGPIPKFIYMALALMIMLHAPGRVWYLPFLVLIVGALIGSMFAENIGYAQDLIVKILLLYYVLAIGSFTFIKSVEKTTLLLHLFFWQFVWWSFHSDLQMGLVSWHSNLGNEDGFGPLMVIGVGYCYYFGMAARKRSLRSTAFLLSGLCVVGVVSSFARGAVLALGVVIAYVLWRSPRKGRSIVMVAIGFVVFVLAAQVLFPGGEFWQEMSTVSQGFDDQTGYDRWVLWKTAWRAFLERPIFGVGAGNFGVFTINNLFWSDPVLVDHFRASPGRLWGKPVHNLYFQVLSEFGLVGAIAFVAFLIDFWKRNAELRSAALVSGWWSATHHRFDLRMLSLALEAAMVGFLANGFFYNQFYVHWLYSILIVNRVLHVSAVRVVEQDLHYQME